MGCFLSAVDRGVGPADVADEDRVGETDEGGAFLDDSRVDEFVQRGVERGGHGRGAKRTTLVEPSSSLRCKERVSSLRS